VHDSILVELAAECIRRSDRHPANTTLPKLLTSVALKGHGFQTYAAAESRTLSKLERAQKHVVNGVTCPVESLFRIVTLSGGA